MYIIIKCVPLVWNKSESEKKIYNYDSFNRINNNNYFLTLVGHPKNLSETLRWMLYVV